MSDYVVVDRTPLLDALAKMDANARRIVFVVSSSGTLLGSLSDGDVRRWLIHHTGDVANATALDARHAEPIAVTGTSRQALPSLFRRGVHAVPMLDGKGRIEAVAFNEASRVQVGRHEVGEGVRTLVVAEIGNNHNGDLSLAREMVASAKEQGADAVKFQHRRLEHLYRQTDRCRTEDLAAEYTVDLVRRFSLAPRDMERLISYCRSIDIDPLCTPWDTESLKDLLSWGVPAIKIASADLTNHPLVREAADANSPLIVSTGMSTEAEISATIALLEQAECPYILLHCQSTYPAAYANVNLRYLQRLKQLTDAPVGYSGHERGYHVALAAVAMGANLVEKHFTFDRSAEGVDHKVSLLPKEFGSMITELREIEESLGSESPRGISAGEFMNRANLAKSLVAIRDLPKGHVLMESDLDARSPGRGIQPNRLGEVAGATLQNAVLSGDFILESDIRPLKSTPRAYSFRRPWGIPVRYHDFQRLTRHVIPSFVEFHFSYKDLDVDVDSALPPQIAAGYACHVPDLFAGDFILDLASPDRETSERSIRELQRCIDVTRSLRPRFSQEDDPILVCTMGGFTMDGHTAETARAGAYERILEALKSVDSSGVRLLPQTLPPFPWLMGGQRYHNLFLDPRDTAAFAEGAGLELCLDVSHTQLAATFLGIDMQEAVQILAPISAHVHLADAKGVDGEGAQLGTGDLDIPKTCALLNQLCPNASFIPEIWQGHVNDGEEFWVALDLLEGCLV